MKPKWDEDTVSLREQINWHIRHGRPNSLFRCSINPVDMTKFEKHAPLFAAAWKDRGDVQSALALEQRRLTTARLNAKDLRLSTDGQEVLDLLGELSTLWKRNDELQQEVDRLAQASVAGVCGDGEIWHDAEGHPIRVLRPTDKMATGQAAGGRPELGQIVRAMVTGRDVQRINAALGTGSVSTGGALVPTELAAEVIDLMRARTHVIRAGARTVVMPTKSLTFAKVTGDPSLSWAAEAASISDTGPTFGTVTLTAKTLRAWVKVSRELIEDAPNLGQVLRDTFARAMAVELDRVALVGSGSGQEPLGIAAASGAAPIVSMGTDGAALTSWDPVLDCLQTLQDANAGDPSAMILAPRTATAMAKLKDSTGQPLQVPADLVGIPRYATTSMPVDQTQGASTDASSIVLGDWRDLLIGARSELQIVRSDGAFMQTNEIGLLFVMRADIAWTRSASFVQLRGITS